MTEARKRAEPQKTTFLNHETVRQTNQQTDTGMKQNLKISKKQPDTPTKVQKKYLKGDKKAHFPPTTKILNSFESI